MEVEKSFALENFFASALRGHDIRVKVIEDQNWLDFSTVFFSLY